jgi:hypothetical protein
LSRFVTFRNTTIVVDPPQPDGVASLVRIRLVDGVAAREAISSAMNSAIKQPGMMPGGLG